MSNWVLAMSNWVYILKYASMLSVLNDSYVYKWLILAYITYITLLQCTRVHGVYEWHSSRENRHWTETISERARYREYWPTLNPHCIYIVYFVTHYMYTRLTLDRVLNTSCFQAILYTTLFSSWTEYKCHVHVRSDSLACVVIADNDYPPRVAFTLMSKVTLTVVAHT